MKAFFGGLDRTTKPAKTGRLFRKYAALLMAIVALALIPSVLLDIWLAYRQLQTLLVRVQTEQANSAADKIAEFVRGIEGQLAWTVQLPLAAKSDDDLRFDAVRLLRQAPAITEFVQLDDKGRQRYRTSRPAMHVLGTEIDRSQDDAFVEAIANKVYYGPVYFRRESEPYMTIALAGPRRDYGVVIVQVNLKFIWDVVSHINVGERGRVFVVDRQNRLIAHPDISLVLGKLDLSGLAQVQMARADSAASLNEARGTADFRGRSVLSAHAAVTPLGWLVFAELPVDEAYAPIYAMLVRSSLLLLIGLLLAFVAGLLLARRMIGPIRALSQGASRIGGGDLTQRISIATGDELEILGDQFNQMAGRLQDSYSTLERKVAERTRDLEQANFAKSRFLAVASHDLRQPLHAIGLFVAQLRGRINAGERQRIVARIEMALSAMNELFNALLDVSKLDAGVLTPTFTDFAAAQLFKQVEATFAGLAREKGLDLRIEPTNMWIRSDVLLLTRIVSNLVANAVRYTSAGGLLIGCRREGENARIEIWDTGPGIPKDQFQRVFGEFYRLNPDDRDQRGNLGLGLAIVDRLSRLLNHVVRLKSTVGKGSCFSILVPIVAARLEQNSRTPPPRPRVNLTNGKLIVVIDDDPLVLESMGGLIQNWGCSVVTGRSEQTALTVLAECAKIPDAIISDYRLRNGRTGIDAIADLRRVLARPIPAFLMSGDTDPETIYEAKANGYSLLHKPVDPMALRATLTQVLRSGQSAYA